MISIHAPAWGATSHLLKTSMIFENFNPRTRMGCDRIAPKVCEKYVAFQSTHPHGVRHHDLSDSVVLLDISIHAPAWGATGFGKK